MSTNSLKLWTLSPQTAHKRPCLLFSLINERTGAVSHPHPYLLMLDVSRLFFPLWTCHWTIANCVCAWVSVCVCDVAVGGCKYITSRPYSGDRHLNGCCLSNATFPPHPPNIYFFFKLGKGLFFFIPVPRGMRDLLSPTRDWTHAPCSRSVESFFFFEVWNLNH